ncbi:hypothetical protein HNQ91_002987 [Filimonas zeae]|uniref:hypothetical protein n=1 Tax=Filimonas zeae TaxID=1737353 RepID=UPI00166BE596|nr:hypothetical protein [Filimonas zeae]MDR6339922.1 hypothetical protein [Filimonas zeae]
MRYFLLIDNSQYIIMKVKLADVEKFLAIYGNRLLLQANSLFELLDLFEAEIVHTSPFHRN